MSEFIGIIEYVEIIPVSARVAPIKSQSFKTCPKEDQVRVSSTTSGFLIKKVLKEDKSVSSGSLQQELGNSCRPLRIAAVSEDCPDWKGLMSTNRQRETELQFKTVITSKQIDQKDKPQERSSSSVFESRFFTKPSTLIPEPPSSKTIFLGKDSNFEPEGSTTNLKPQELPASYDRTSQDFESLAVENQMRQRSIQ